MKPNDWYKQLSKRYKKFVKDLNPNQKVLLKNLEFLFLFNLFLIPLYLIWILKMNLHTLNKSVAFISYSILARIGVPVVLTEKFGGISIGLEGFSEMFISNACSGIIPIFLMAALLLATRGSNLKTKSLYVLTLIPVIYAVNIVRIVLTILIGVNYGMSLFDISHNFLWNYIMILIVLLFWLFFLKKENIKFSQ